MTLNEYQQMAMKTAIFKDECKILYPALALAEEAGEVCGKIAKFMRDETDHEKLKEAVTLELGDVMWQIAALAKGFDINLEVVGQQNILKLRKRDANNTLSGSGDHR